MNLMLRLACVAVVVLAGCGTAPVGFAVPLPNGLDGNWRVTLGGANAVYKASCITITNGVVTAWEVGCSSPWRISDATAVDTSGSPMKIQFAVTGSYEGDWSSAHITMTVVQRQDGTLSGVMRSSGLTGSLPSSWEASALLIRQ